MKKVLFGFLSIAFLCVMVTGANADVNGQGKWALHYAGEHNSKINTCDFLPIDCLTEVVVDAPMGPGRWDIYILALDTDGIAGTRYGLCCDPPVAGFWFYGWTNCADFEIPSAGWPGCNTGNAQTWIVQQPAGHVTLGILDVYVYAGVGGMLCICDDPREGFAEWCDGTSPEPICLTRTVAEKPQVFGCVGFGIPGYNPCGIVATEKSSWGAVKSLYR
jgi:hypothetical protein